MPDFLRTRGPRVVLAGLLAMVPAGTATAEEALVAVAANFAEVMERLESRFEAATGHTLTVTTGSTGKLYAQIVNGAPFDVLLAADRERPRRLADEGLGVPETRVTYAIGRLTLWSPDPETIAEDGQQTLMAGKFNHLALANPKLAPYGAAARETLENLGLWPALRDRIVQGENIGQTFAMVATGNAELGFVALSYVTSPRNEAAGSRWEVPAALYTPIRQDAILLARAADNAAARDFVAFLQEPETRGIIERFGYDTE